MHSSNTPSTPLGGRTVLSPRVALMLRVGLGVVFLWFGALKLVPGLSPADDIAGRTLMAMTGYCFECGVLVRSLGILEILMGVAFIAGFAMRPLLILFFLHMIGTFVPFFLFPDECFRSAPYGLTLLGQYIIKNVVLVGGGIVLLAHYRNPAAKRAGPQSIDPSQHS